MGDQSVEPQGDDRARGGGLATRLNWLRAGVMGANDGIVSTAGLVVGVAGASVSDRALFAAGVSAVLAGALSMGVGEFVSVSSQRDSQRAELELERGQLEADPESELDQLTGLVQDQGIDRDLARRVAEQLTLRDPLAAHARLHLGIDPEELTNPWHAAWASTLAFVVGAIIPLMAILLSPRGVAVPVTGVAVIAALVITGAVSAHLGNAPKPRAATRTVMGGVLAMAVTFGIGSLIGVQV